MKDGTPEANNPAKSGQVPNGSNTGEPIWCDCCRGRGRIHVAWDWSEGYEEEITEKCDCCNGRGHFDDGEDDESEW